MKTLAADLRSPSQPTRWAWNATGLLALSAIGMVVAAMFAQHRVNQLQAQLDALRAQRAIPVARPQPIVRKMPYDASAREFLALATSQWPSMLTSLESVEMVGVTPVSIEIVVSERVIRVDLEFSDYATLLRYVDTLNAGEPSPRWSIVQAQTSTRGTGSAASVAVVRGVW